MIRTIALLAASAVAILTGVLTTSSRPVADPPRPVQQVINEFHKQIDGFPWCC
jgi:hypothetical protein